MKKILAASIMAVPTAAFAQSASSYIWRNYPALYQWVGPWVGRYESLGLLLVLAGPVILGYYSWTRGRLTRYYIGNVDNIIGAPNGLFFFEAIMLGIMYLVAGSNSRDFQWVIGSTAVICWILLRLLILRLLPRRAYNSIFPWTRAMYARKLAKLEQQQKKQPDGNTLKS